LVCFGDQRRRERRELAPEHVLVIIVSLAICTGIRRVGSRGLRTPELAGNVLQQ
jgi:hypothetical protein